MKKYAGPHHQIEASALDDRAGLLADLELPDAPDFVSRRSPIPFERMMVLLEQYRVWFPPSERQRDQRFARKCDIEFVL
ncbi:MAG: hypothetical protein AB1813_12435 [Verrucomicrobiota bacterium]|jgi:hypothetical protein